MLSGRPASISSRSVVPVKKSTLTPVVTLRGHKDITQSISYFPDGKRIISGSCDKTVREWDIEAGKEIKKARDVSKQNVHAVGVSRDGRWVVSAGGDYTGELKVREVETGTVRTFEGHQLTSSINCIDISGDSTLLASGSLDGTARIWSLETCNLVAGPFKNSVDSVGAVRFSQDSKKLALKSNGGRHLEVWDIQLERLLVYRKGNWDYGADVPAVWTTKDTAIITAFSFEVGAWQIKTIYEFDVSTLETTGAPFEGHTKTITGIALSLDCALLASAARDNTIKLWALESRQLLASFDSRSTICHLIFSPNSRQLVYAGKYDKCIYLCNTPPEIFASIQPVPQDRTVSSKNLFLTDSGTLSHTVNRSTSDAPPNAQESLPFYSLPPPSISFARRQPGSESWIDRHAETSGIQPNDIRPSTDMRQRPADMQSSPDKMLRQHHESGSQPLHQDTLHFNGGPADLPSFFTTMSPVIALPPPPQVPSSVVGSRLPWLPPDSRELLPSSSHTNTVFSSRDDEPRDLPLEAMLQNLTGYITKDEEYPVARGGFGEIWKCTCHMNRKLIKVAVKALQVYAADQLGAVKTKKIKRIMRELRICANLKHPNILPVYGYTHGFGPFLAIVSPWAENGNLSDYLELEGAALTLVRRFQILRDIIAGLQYLHANSVIHGDFTGPNVLIHGNGTACVADFGLSLMYSEVISASQASWTSTLKGNMRWMAPELLIEREDGSQVRPSEQSDMYSFGGIMLQVLTNKAPYYHLTNDAAIILCIAKSQTPSRSRYPELPERYWQFIEKCWSTDPRDRPSTEGAEVTIRNEYYSLSRSP